MGASGEASGHKTGLNAAFLTARLARFLEADRERGFDFGVAPLMRVWLHR